MREDRGHGARVGDGGDDGQAAATARAGQDVEVEHAALNAARVQEREGSSALCGVVSISCAIGSGAGRSELTTCRR